MNVTWWIVLVVALGLAAWGLYATGGLVSWLAAGACAATGMSATLALRGDGGRPELILLYAGFALGLASLLWGVFRRRPAMLAATLAAAWAVAIPLVLPYLP